MKDDRFEQFLFDTSRPERNRFTEVIFCQGKTLEQIARIIKEMAEKGENIFGTRIAPEMATKLIQQIPEVKHDPLSRTIRWMQKEPSMIRGTVGVLAAGTADAAVAEEAWATLRFYGVEAKKFYDVGVAGLHRLVTRLPEIRTCDVLIVVAGMEGALPSVVGGLVAAPVIACPTSVGYGAHLGGLTTLAAMLSSCAEGISVVNIDNGFGAACAALRIFRK